MFRLRFATKSWSARALAWAAFLFIASAAPAAADLPFIFDNVTQPAGLFTSIEVDATGRAHVAYSNPFKGSIEHAFRGPDDPTWQTEAIAESVNVEFSSLALDASGRPHVLYFDGAQGNVVYAFRGETGWVREPVDQTNFPGVLDLEFAGDGTPHVLFTADDEVRYGVRRSNRWTVETIPGFLTNPSLGLDPQGVPHAALLQGGSALVLYMTRLAAGWAPESVDPRPAASPPSLVFDAGGVPHIAYAANVNRQLPALIFSTRLTSGWNNEEAAPEVGSTVDLRIGPDGRFRIAYDRGAPGAGIQEVRLTVRRSDGWMDSFVAGGAAPSLAYHPDGNAVLSYVQLFSTDPPSGALQVAKAAPYGFRPLGAYNLFSFPFEVTVPGVTSPKLSDVFGPVLGAMSDFSWRAFSDEGSVLIEDPVIQAGKGYWINSLVPLPEDFMVDGVEPDFSGIDLTEGWSLISNPSTQVVTAQLCVLADDQFFTIQDAVSQGMLASVIYEYEDNTGDLVNNGTFTAVDMGRAGGISLRPFKAFYVRTFRELQLRANCAQLRYEDVARYSLSSEPAWTLGLSVSSSGVMGAGVELAAADGADAGYDMLDHPTPPFPGTRLFLAADHADWGKFSGLYSRSVAGAASGEQRWPLTVRGARGDVQLTWSGVASLPAGLNAYLLLPSGVGVPLSEGGSFAMPATTAARGFELVVNGAPWSGPTVSSGFEGLTSVQATGSGFLLSYQVLTPGEARLTIHDVQGRLVRDFGAVPGGVGSWQVSWNGTKHSGCRVASGLYLAQFIGGGRRSFARLVLLH